MRVSVFAFARDSINLAYTNTITDTKPGLSEAEAAEQAEGIQALLYQHTHIIDQAEDDIAFYEVSDVRILGCITYLYHPLQPPSAVSALSGCQPTSIN